MSGNEFDEELHGDGVKLTMLYFKAGIRSFPEFADLMIGDFGKRIVGYLPSFYEGVKNSPRFDKSEFDTTSDVENYMAKLTGTADSAEDQLHHLVEKARVWAAMNPVSLGPEEPTQSKLKNSK